MIQVLIPILFFCLHTLRILFDEKFDKLHGMNRRYLSQDRTGFKNILSWIDHKAFLGVPALESSHLDHGSQLIYRFILTEAEYAG